MRLFVAVELDEPVRSKLSGVQAALARECDGVRWIPPHQVHLTLKFLGEVPDGDVESVAEAVHRATNGCEGFEMQIGGCGCFPRGGAVRIVWAGVGGDTGPLRRCAEAVEAELEELGFPKERRPFSAHLTIGRVREDRSGGRIRAAVEAQAFASPTQPVRGITLMSSVLSPKGPTYTAISKADLRESAG